jgi:hypothetical protein
MNPLIASAGTGPTLTVVFAFGSLNMAGDVLLSAGKDFSPFAFHAITNILLSAFIILLLKIAFNARSLLLSNSGVGG